MQTAIASKCELPILLMISVLVEDKENAHMSVQKNLDKIHISRNCIDLLWE